MMSIPPFLGSLHVYPVVYPSIKVVALNGTTRFYQHQETTFMDISRGGPVVQISVGTNLGFNFNLGFFFFLSKHSLR